MSTQAQCHRIDTPRPGKKTTPEKLQNPPINLRFCQVCNYAQPAILIDRARFDFPCTNCNSSKIRNFYSYGSTTHRECWETYEYLTEDMPRPTQLRLSYHIFPPLPYPYHVQGEDISVSTRDGMATYQFPCDKCRTMIQIPKDCTGHTQPVRCGLCGITWDIADTMTPPDTPLGLPAAGKIALMVSQL